MKRLLMVAAGCAALAMAVTGCDSRADYRAKRDAREALKVVTRLDCPEGQGDLKRVSAAADGLSCVYAGGDSEVTLQLVSFTGKPDTALKPIEDGLLTLFPAKGKTSTAVSQESGAVQIQAQTDADSGDKATVRGPGVSVDADGDNGKARVRAPGVAVDADGDKARVRAPGVSIDADGDKAHVKIFGVEINADDSSNEVRITQDRWGENDENNFNVDDSGDEASVNKKGLNFGRSKQGFRRIFLKTSDEEGAPFKAVGYEARGPKNGPLVVAVVKSKAKGSGGASGSLFKDARALVKRNVGG